MYQFFIPSSQIMGNDLVIRGKDVNHIKNVLRMKPGEEISIKAEGDDKEYRCEIASLEEEEIRCRLMFIKEEGVELPCNITLYQGLPKSDKMEWIIQKAVELGVSRIVPVASKRAVVKLDEKKAEQKRKRWQSISEAAAKQSKRGRIPEIAAVMTMSQAVEYASGDQVKIMAYELAEGMESTKQLIENIKPGENISLFIGPEGGFTEEEVILAKEKGFRAVTLGRRILRTETAGMTVLAWLMYHLEQ